MEFLDKFVIPQSLEHIELLHYLAALVLFIFIPFISIVFGSTLLSLYYKRKGNKEGNDKYINFAKDLVSKLTVNKNVGIVLGIVPLITITIIYAQLLHSASNLSISYLFISSILIIIGLILIYTYRYSMSFSLIFNSLGDFKPDDKNVGDDLNKLSDTTKKLSVSTGCYGVIVLTAAIWFYLSGMHLALYPELTDTQSIFAILFSFDVIFRLFFFIVFAIAITGGTILFRYFYWEGGITDLDDDYKNLVKKTGIKTAFYFSALIPVFLTFNLQTLPKASLSTSVFVYAGLLLFTLFVCYNLLYSMTKNGKANYAGTLFILLILSMCFSLAKDQLAMNNATKLQALKLSQKYDALYASLTGETKKAPEIKGEDVYKIRCTPCHSFDHKIVGPPYNETLPKYENNMDGLVNFLMNPKKINDKYPPMPNPGLKPAEAKAVAKYILETYKK